MTDRELLEAAAKACALRIDRSPHNGGGSGNTGFDALGNVVLDWHNGKKWNPLQDDGDALRLAVKLRLHIDCHAYSGVTAWVFFDSGANSHLSIKTEFRYGMSLTRSYGIP